MSLPTYSQYKDSGTAIVGAVPHHWQMKPVKAIASINDDVLPETTEPTYELTYVDIGSVSLGSGIERTETFTFKDAPSRARRLVRDGDVIISTVRTYLKAIASIVEPPENLVVSTGFAVVRPLDMITPGFAKYALQSPAFVDTVISRSTGVSYPAINASDLARIALPVPPRDEQFTIATFLDRETSKIDALIAEQEKLLELLAEKRQATISHAVTRGLNPDVPLRDSGVEWLGAVPAHWEVVGLTKYLDSIVDYRGRTPTKVDNGVFLVTAKNIRSGAIDYEASQEYIDVAEYDEVMRRGRPLKGDVLFTTEAPLGQVAIVDREDIALAQRIIKFRPAPRHLDSAYLKVWIMGSACQFNLELLATGSTALGIKGSKVGQVRLCLPPLEEQQEIVRHINIELSKLSALDAESKRAIELLKERRSALISAAVTGKIDVREHSSALAAAA
ncbi:restriction endonuclease subunit S [Burkholderia multivorans]|uniref:restriction endonuclease subunit S n=1 Tax=Burkholderia multivorans TaxID=87883 RepID=UPI000D005E8C|nr:restriction endonuclease subunit S [Burkholderia multivorans]PRF31905.1 restriction endonuclease subunit S [Burkholderia multivorans]